MRACLGEWIVLAVAFGLGAGTERRSRRGRIGVKFSTFAFVVFLHSSASIECFLLPLPILDFPLSLVADTLLLPLDLSYGNRSAPEE